MTISDLQAFIDKETKASKKLISGYKKAKKNVDEIINTYLLGYTDPNDNTKNIVGIMNDEDFIHDEDYIAYFKEQKPDEEVTADMKKEWIESLKGEDGRKDKIRLAAKYSRQGKDEWANKVEKAEKAKKRQKEAVRVEGEKIVGYLNELLAKFDKEIEVKEAKLKQKISSIESDIKTLDSQIENLQQKKNKLDTEFIKAKLKADDPLADEKKKAYNDSSEKLKKEIKELTTKRKKLEKNELHDTKDELEQVEEDKKLKEEYRIKIDEQMRAFTKKIYDETGIEVQLNKSNYEKDSQPNSNPSNTTQTVAGNGTQQIDSRKPKQIVAAQTIDLKHASPSEIMEMVDGKSGYNELLEASREAGPLQSKVVRKEMERRLEDLLSEINPVNGKYIIGNLQLTQEELSDLSKLSEKEILKITTQIKEYIKTYDNAKGYKQQKIDKEMQILKLSVLLTETRTGRIARWEMEHGFFAAFLGKHRQDARLRVQDFGNELRELAGKVESRSAFQTTLKDRVFDKFGWERDPKEAKKKSFDRSGKRPIQRQGSER